MGHLYHGPQISPDLRMDGAQGGGQGYEAGAADPRGALGG